MCSLFDSNASALHNGTTNDHDPMQTPDGSMRSESAHSEKYDIDRNTTIRVVIVDDQELVRAGFAMVIDSQDDMRVVGQAGDGTQAVSLCESLQADVVLMDVRMPGMDGIEATRRITDMEIGRDDVQPFVQEDEDTDINASGSAGTADNTRKTTRTTRVIILTTFDLDEYVMAAIDAGASGFLLKDTEPETLLSSIRTVFQGNAIIAPTATKRLIETMMHSGFSMHRSEDSSNANQLSSGPAPERHRAYRDPELDELTDREREVLTEIAHGLSNQEIADKLFISLPTVKTHVAHILAKINARDRVQAVVFAYDNGLV
jgi:DNA-binding NarL/FixJ family response regulator